MQPEASAPDPSAVGASSPPLTPFRHPQPLTAADNDDRLRLRRKASASSKVALHIKTPYAEHGVTQPTIWEVPLTWTVGNLKDAIADGSAGYGLWEREAMRLICRGRMLEDYDTLGRALPKGETPTLHLVARPLKSADAAAQASTTAPPAIMNDDQASATTSSPPPLPSATATALSDTVHYLLFAAREHLCALLGAPNIAWDDMYPAPTVERSIAREAVASVLRSMAPGAGWEAALEGDDGDLEAVWTRLSDEGVRNEVCSLWKTATGREFGSSGDSTSVELDGKTLTLHLPPVNDMAPSQATHLLLYLRITVLLPHLCSSLSAAQEQSQPTRPRPTPTRRSSSEPPRVRVIYRPAPGMAGFHLQGISMNLLVHAFWSAFRILLIIFMLGRNLSWGDSNLWLMLAAGGAWWAFDAYSHWAVERRQERARQREERTLERAARAAERGARRRRGNDYVVREYGADGEIQAEEAGAGVRQARRREVQRLFQRRDPMSQQARECARVIPLYHLEVDARQLRLPASAIEVPSGSLPTTPVAAPELRRAPSTHPGWFSTHVLLPLSLWFVTLVPDFEAQRARAIRQRERAIRALVNEHRDQASAVEGGDQQRDQASAEEGGDEQRDQAFAEAGGDEQREQNSATEGEEETRPQWLPEGISPTARKYYERVMARPEAIDWDEEREAQRAMGIPDEEREQERFGML